MSQQRQGEEEKRRGKGKIYSFKSKSEHFFLNLFFKKRQPRERERERDTPSSKKPHLIVNVRDVFVAVDVIQSLLPGFFQLFQLLQLLFRLIGLGRVSSGRTRGHLFSNFFSPGKISERVLKRENRDLSFFGRLKSTPVAEPAVCERVCVCVRVYARVCKEKTRMNFSLCVFESALSIFESQRARSYV
jgi:hypothetical protein